MMEAQIVVRDYEEGIVKFLENDHGYYVDVIPNNIFRKKTRFAIWEYEDFHKEVDPIVERLRKEYDENPPLTPTYPYLPHMKFFNPA